MKNKIIKSIIALVLAFVALPMAANDYLKIYFKDGHTERHYMKLVDNISVTKYDLEGNLHSDYQMQQIVMADTTYSYYLSDIESMTFTKVEEDELEKNVESVENNVTPIFEQCSTVEEMEARIDDIKRVVGVEDVWREGRNIVVQVRDWRKVYFYFPLIHKNDRKSFVPSILKSRSIKKKPLKKDGTPISVVIAFQMTKDSRFDEEKNSLLELRDDLQTMGLDVHFIPDDTEDEILDIDFYKNRMFDYDIVILDTHGSYSDGKHTFFTSEEVKGLSWYSLWEYLDAFDIDDIDIGNTGNRSYKIINEDLISKSNGKFHGSGPHIVFNGACESLSGDGELIREHNGESKPYTGSDAVAKIFFDKGADIYMGYNESTVNCGFAACDYFGLMLSGYSQEASFYNLWDGYKDEDTEYKAALIDLINPNLDSEIIKRLFLFKTLTKEKTEKELNDEYKQNKMIKLNGEATLFSYGNSDYSDSSVKLGFELIYYDPVTNTQRIKAESYPISYSDKVEFYANIDNLLPGRTYNYRAYTFDGIHYNYGNTYTFKIDAQSTDDKAVMLTKTVGNTTYEIYKINTDKNDYHINPDGWKCYKSSLMLDMTKNGKTNTYTLDDNIYLDSSESHHGGQRPCLFLDTASDQLFVFINSKDSRYNYTMDGYAYGTSLSNVCFSKETVFVGANWGWSPYFTYSDGVLSVQHFSYAGYYAMTSYRNSDGTWTTQQGNYIKPDAFNEQSEQAGNVLVEDNSGVGGDVPAYTSCPDEHHPHMIDLGLPSGTKWACCNVGASKPEDYGGYYAWGETEEKDSYSCYSYTLRLGGSYETYRNVGSNIAGTEYDVANAKWGEAWVMPNYDQIKELFDNCSSEWVIQNGVGGRCFTGPNGYRIFFPAAGNYSYELLHTGYYGYYWSSSLSGGNNAYSLFICSSGEIDWRSPRRDSGLSVRPVRKN